MNDPVAIAVYSVLIALGMLTLVRWALGDIGEFWKWFKKWRKGLGE